MRLILFTLILAPLASVWAERIAIWPDHAPGETVKQEGVALPSRDADRPPITRVEKITQPTLEAYLPEGGGNGAAVLVLPGGGFGYVVPDLEGSETAAFLNPLGVSVFVLSYRTKLGNEAELWRRPLQDSQRALRFLRKNAGRWGLDPEKVGLLAFSAGGQVGAVQIGEIGDAYPAVDSLDELSARPDFALLIYPWNVGDNSTGKLMGAIKLGAAAPPTFLVHTDDDKSSALGAAAIYMGLKRAGVSAELHIYQNGGHGYGTRDRGGSVIGTWKDRAADWLRVRGLADVVAEPLKMVPDGNYLVNIEKPDGVKKLLNYQVRAGVAECVNASAQDSVGLKGKFSYVEDGVFKIHVSNARHNGTLFWKFGDDGIAQVKEVPDRGEKQFAVPVEGDTLIYPTQ